MPDIWKKPVDLGVLAAISQDTAVTHVGIEFLEVGADFIRVRIPVDARTRQPYGLLHGGMSLVLAETMGSIAGAFAAPPGHLVVGVEINANHIRSATDGWVTGTARPVHLGGTTQVWQIELRDDQDRLTCLSRLTLAVLAPRSGRANEKAP